jgi:hypothetical protein
MPTAISTISQEQLVEALAELMRTRREEFVTLFAEAAEHIGMAAAIQEGRANDFVSEEEVFALLHPHDAE